MKTQLEVIQSRNTLYHVVDSLKLDENWEVTRVDAVESLIDALTVTRLGDAMITKVRYIGSHDTQMVANIANNAAAVYQNRTISLWSEKMNNALDTLQKQLKAEATESRSN